MLYANYLVLFTKLLGFRLVALASRLSSEDNFSRALHVRLIDGLQAAIEATRRIMKLERAASNDM